MESMRASSGGVLIVGAGLAGLSCALSLQKRGVPFTLFEASDAVGGRVRTDKEDGFLLDRGFQIFLTAYEEAAQILDYGALDFKPFLPGAMVRAGSRFHHLSDPFRRPSKIFETMLSPVGTMRDKLTIARLKCSLASRAGITNQRVTTLESLKDQGFSEDIIGKFFRPFLSGIFLESELETASSVFEFVFSMLSKGDNVLPAQGMQSIPEQMAARLPCERLNFNCKVREVAGKSITLASGARIDGLATVIATDEAHAAMLLGQRLSWTWRG